MKKCAVIRRAPWCVTLAAVTGRRSRRKLPLVDFNPMPPRIADRACHHTVAQHQHGAITHMPTNLWQPGVSGNPAGRLRGSRNALSEEVICALLRDFRQHGQKAVARVRRTQPAAYLKILALLVPRDVKVEHSGGVKAMTDEQLEAGIEAIQRMLEARAPGDRATVIEGTAETVALPAPDPDDKPRRPNRVMDAADTAVGPKERKPRRRMPSPG